MFSWWMLKGFTLGKLNKTIKIIFSVSYSEVGAHRYWLPILLSKFSRYFFAPESHGYNNIEEKVAEMGVIEQKRCDLSQLI